MRVRQSPLADEAILWGAGIRLFTRPSNYNWVIKMTVFVHCKSKFNRCLNRLRKAGGNASLAAKRAEEIIGKLASEERMMSEETNKRTKYGELRINKCRKYDLGGGYRLICVRQGKHLAPLYVGSHDDCDRWLNNNRGFQPVINKDSNKSYSIRKSRMIVQSPEKKPEPEMDYDAILMEKIDQKTFRRIFRGLCGERDVI